ncbi:MAG: CPP1-like family protein [Scytolyngbya sp. HA4215-MV1]|jgi:hypothetical protein|nr:CPP1-like family protein [Scytolyngbya sp. HA4215-MV1]
MDEQSPYEKLGVTESASFDEIKEARDRLFEQCEGDGQLREAIESAYDAVLMDRLRMRQEGKIKVPDRIRFPEKITPTPVTPIPEASKQSPDWLKRMVDTPSQQDIWLPAGLFVGLAAISGFTTLAPLALALGVLVSIYFLNRKENKLGRALLLTLMGASIGIFLGLQLYKLLIAQVPGTAMIPGDTVAAWLTFVLLWLITAFLR